MSFIVNYAQPIIKANINNPTDVGSALLSLNAVDEDWARDVGLALDRIQDAIATVFANLKVPLPKMTKFEFTDPQGRAACIIGYYVPGSTGPTTASLINFFSQITVASSPDPTQAGNVLTIDPVNFLSIAPGVGAVPILNITQNGLFVAEPDLAHTGLFVHEPVTAKVSVNVYADRVEIVTDNQATIGDYYKDHVAYQGNQIITVRQTGPGNTTDVTDVATRFNNLLTALRTHGLIT